MIRIWFTFFKDWFIFLKESALLAWRLMIKPQSNDYHAEFDTNSDLLSVFNEGVVLTGKQRLSKENSLRHTIVIGSSGSRKSTTTFFPSLLMMTETHSNFCIHDPSKELYQCAGFLSKEGYDIKVLDFSSERSLGFNPLSKIKDENDASQLASMLIRTVMGYREPFWDNASAILTETCINLAIRLQPQYRNMANVRRLIQMLGTHPQQFEELVIKHGTDKVFNEYKNLLGYDPKVLKGIVASCSSGALGIFNNETVARVTSADTFDFSDLRKKPVALFIQNRISDIKYYNTLISIFLESLFKSLMRDLPSEKDRTVYFFIDEAASGLYMPSFSNVIANSRKARLPFLLGIQDISQLTDTYSREEGTTILTNCYNKLYMNGMSLDTASMLEQTLGKYTYAEGKAKHVRSLMTADELRMMPADKGILISGNYKPVYANLHPWFTQRKLRARMNLPLPILKTDPLPPVDYIKLRAKPKEK